MRQIAAATAIVIGMMATAALAYLLQPLAEPSQATGQAEQVAAAIAATTGVQGRV